MAKCNDENKLTMPLEQVCDSVNLGCITTTNGQPTWTPTSDQLPIALDDNGTSLWLYDCTQWVEFTSSICGSNNVDISALNQACDILKVPVFYSINGQCTEGATTLQQLAEQLYTCLQWDTDIQEFRAIVVNPTTMRLEIVEDTTTLPLYFSFEDLTVSGSGTQTDPVVITGPTPHCELPDNSASVNDTNTTVVACVDGVDSRVDVSAPVCAQPNVGDLEDGDEVLICDTNGLRKKSFVEPDPCSAPLTAPLTVGDTVLACNGTAVERKTVTAADDPCDAPDGGDLESTDNIVVCRNGDMVLTQTIPWDGAEPCQTRIRHEDGDPLIEVYEEASCGDCCGFVIRSVGTINDVCAQIADLPQPTARVGG